ncbi:10354_t:CDS:1, partial [Racocetra persica]
KSETNNSVDIIEISQYLAQLYDKAFIAEECKLKTNQEEILYWYHYKKNLYF